MSSSDVQLRFFSLAVGVRTDVPHVGQFCRRLFARFIEPPAQADTTLEIMTAGDGVWRVRDAVVDALVDRPAWLAGIATARLLETAGNEVSEHDLFHGAALSRNGRGLIVCGESGFGKSVLTLSLLSRGWQFLSDEVAAVDGAASLLLPFPKAIEALPNSLRLVGVEAPGRPERRGKLLFDPEALFPGCLGDPVTVGEVIFLQGHEPDSEPAGGAGELEVVVHRRAEGLLEELAATEGVRSASWSGSQSGCPVLRLELEPRRFDTWRLDELLARHGTLVVSSSAEDRPPADFSHEPRLSPLGVTAGVGRLLGRFRGRRALATKIQRHPGGFGGLFLSLVERLSATRFYTLEVGRLDAMLDLLEGLEDG